MFRHSLVVCVSLLFVIRSPNTIELFSEQRKQRQRETPGENDSQTNIASRKGVLRKEMIADKEMCHLVTVS